MINVSIVGGSGYTGGELIRLLLFHPECTVRQVTSERFAGKALHRAHPNLRKASQLKFCALAELEPCDVLFLCLPHGETASRFETFSALAPRIIDLSADFVSRIPQCMRPGTDSPILDPNCLSGLSMGSLK